MRTTLALVDSRPYWNENDVLDVLSFLAVVYEGTGVSGGFYPIQMSMFGLGLMHSVGLSSSSLPVGQEDRDGSLSAGLWLEPSPWLPRSTHTGNWSWQEVGMHSSPTASSSPPFSIFLSLFSLSSYLSLSLPACACYYWDTPPWYSCLRLYIMFS